MIDADIADMEKRSQDKLPTTAPAVGREKLPEIIAAVLKPAERPSIDVEHVPPKSFQRGQAVTITMRLPKGHENGPSPRIYYRRVNQAEAYRSQGMEPAVGREGEFAATVPAQYTDSPFPLQYYFELQNGGGGQAWMFPGLGSDWNHQPYFVVRQARPTAVRT
jgi:hypothetical protein